jgi:hypothetical protein
MHKLMKYICDELDDLERKADKDGKLSAVEIQYADMLANIKKNLLKTDEMMGEGEYSNSYARGGNSYRYSRVNSYDRGRGSNARRDNRGRYSNEGYSMAGDDMIDELMDLMQDAPNEQTRMEFQRFINKIENMR